MIDFTQLLRCGSTHALASAQSKKAAIEDASELLADAFDIDARTLLEGLLNRERLGSTGLGQGVAIPHCRCADCTGPIGALLTLREAIDFDAPDDEPVDVLFVLVVPESEQRTHLEILGALARVFDEPANLFELRSAKSREELFDVFQHQISAAQWA